MSPCKPLVIELSLLPGIAGSTLGDVSALYCEGSNPGKANEWPSLKRTLENEFPQAMPRSLANKCSTHTEQFLRTCKDKNRIKKEINEER